MKIFIPEVKIFQHIYPPLLTHPNAESVLTFLCEWDSIKVKLILLV
jgi:hypothetical protein